MEFNKVLDVNGRDGEAIKWSSTRQTHTHRCVVFGSGDSDCRDGKALPLWHVRNASLPAMLTTALFVVEQSRVVTFEPAVGRKNNCTACWNEQPP